MQDATLHPPSDSRQDGRTLRAGLRDADWAWVAGDQGERTSGERARQLHRWPAQRATGLTYQSLDGNPRHGLLALWGDVGEWLDAIEVLERQGCWVVMPDFARARALATAALLRTGASHGLRSNRVSTPDRRFVFFNAPVDGSVAVFVERRREDGPLIHEPMEPR